jgi:hypothetical protein
VWRARMCRVVLTYALRGIEPRHGGSAFADARPNRDSVSATISSSFARSDPDECLDYSDGCSARIEQNMGNVKTLLADPYAADFGRQSPARAAARSSFPI